MKKRIVWVGSVGMAMLGASMITTSCASPTGEPRIQRRKAALVGAPIDTEHAFSVGVCAGPPNENADAGAQGACASGRCSGTLIAPNLVLTARHCVESPKYTSATYCSNSWSGKPKPASAMFVTTAASSTTGAPTWRAVSEVRLPPGSNNCDDDVALLVVATNVPAGEAAPASVDITTNIATTKPDLVAVVARGALGFRHAVDAGYAPVVVDNGEAKRRILENIPLVCASDTDGACNIADFTSPPSNVFALPRSMFLIGPNATAPGDSGSAVIDQTSLSTASARVIGVNTLVTAAEDGSVSGGQAVRTSLHADFLVAGAKAAAMKGGYPLPAWASKEPTPEREAPPQTPPTSDGDDDPTEDRSEGATMEGSAPPSTTATSSCAATPRRPGRPTLEATPLLALALALGFGAVRRRRRD